MQPHVHILWVWAGLLCAVPASARSQSPPWLPVDSVTFSKSSEFAKFAGPVSKTLDALRENDNPEFVDQTCEVWSGSEWTRDSRRVNLFNDSGNWTGYIDQTWDGIAWVTNRGFRYSIQYDQYGNRWGVEENWDETDWELTTRQWSKRLDERLIEMVGQVWEGAGWEYEYHVQVTYNEKGKRTLYVYQEWNGLNWFDTGLNYYLYDENGNNVEYYAEVLQNGNWVYAERNLGEYDLNGNVLDFIHQRGNGPSWVNEFRVVSSYDVAGNRTERIDMGWSNGWYNVERYSVTYDAQGRPIDEIESYFQDGHWEFQDRFLSGYNENGQPVDWVWQDWQDGQWVNRKRWTAAYDDSGRHTESIDWTWSGNDWIFAENGSRLRLLYDESGNLIQEFRDRAAGSEWVDNVRCSYRYDPGVLVGAEDSPTPESHGGSFVLSQNYPNPFATSTRIDYKLRRDGLVRLSVHDLLGRQVSILVDAVKVAGAHTVTWNAEERSAGSYFYRIEADGKVETRRMVVNK